MLYIIVTLIFLISCIADWLLTEHEYKEDIIHFIISCVCLYLITMFLVGCIDMFFSIVANSLAQIV